MIALMYHDVVPDGAEDSSGFPGPDAALYKVTPEQFDRHLRAIRAALTSLDWHSPRELADPLDPLDLPDSRALAITFDDGGATGLKTADLLERHGFVGHFFITTNYIGTRGFMSAPELRELASRGHAIGSHSSSHPLRMRHCSWPHVLNEWVRSRADLAEILGNDVDIASVPGGDYGPKVAEAAAVAGFARLFTSEPTAETRRAFSLQLVGRYTIRRSTTVETVAALAAGDWLPRLRQSVVWKAKKATKLLGGAQYLALRKMMLGSADVRWGDS